MEIKKWDSYLANYAAALPNQANRAGTFQTFTSFWDMIFPTDSPPFSPSDNRNSCSKDDIFAPDKLISSPTVMRDLALQSSGNLGTHPPVSSLPGTTTDIFKKARSTTPKGFTKWKKKKGTGTVGDTSKAH